MNTIQLGNWGEGLVVPPAMLSTPRRAVWAFIPYPWYATVLLVMFFCNTSATFGLLARNYLLFCKNSQAVVRLKPLNVTSEGNPCTSWPLGPICHHCLEIEIWTFKIFKSKRGQHESCDFATVVHFSSTENNSPSKFGSDWQLKIADDNHQARGREGGGTRMQEIHFRVRGQIIINFFADFVNGCQ